MVLLRLWSLGIDLLSLRLGIDLLSLGIDLRMQLLLWRMRLLHQERSDSPSISSSRDEAPSSICYLEPRKWFLYLFETQGTVPKSGNARDGFLPLVETQHQG